MENTNKIKLNPMENVVVLVPTRERFDKLMKVYESAGWMWVNDIAPTKPINFDGWKHGNKTCIDAGFYSRLLENPERKEGRFGFGNLDLFLERGYDVISDNLFYKMQGVKI